jgi:hypothetical protein
MSAPRWGIWCVRLGRWLTRAHARGVDVTVWFPTEAEAARTAAELNLGTRGPAAYVAKPLASL